MSDRITELRVSARGWHGIQLAVIGFIGLCGVLQGGRPDNPMWLQVLAGILALAALAIACLATFLVALVAWPLYSGGQASDDAAELRRDGRRLKQGLVLTFLALAILAVATASGWWPQEETGAEVAVQATSGERWCGALADAGQGTVGLDVDGDPVVVSLQDVAVIESC